METTSTTQTPAADRPDTHSMVIVHRGMRRESRLLARLVAAVAPGDTARAAVLAGHFRDYRLGLHNHHHGEDELLWPVLLGRVDLGADVVLRMEAQHERVAETLARAEAALPAWEATAGEAERDALAAALTDHHAVLTAHMDDEETALLPLAAQHLTAHEWNALGEHFLAATPKPKLLFFLGMVLEDAEPAERADMLAGLPGFARLLWRLVGRPSYVRRMRAIRGSN
ncbi:hemerythrin domain-containing protein [Yinghuangia sp. YIM S09857]|uniref:hemerythrin domain-containing protein n=1 Tax=Yinghuangia sp. YIM S09857 TaxID=3436929 RepID=UPI003F53D2DD